MQKKNIPSHFIEKKVYKSDVTNVAIILNANKP